LIVSPVKNGDNGRIIKAPSTVTPHEKLKGNFVIQVAARCSCVGIIKLPSRYMVCFYLRNKAQEQDYKTNNFNNKRF
jgi:hypothetical protein